MVTSPNFGEVGVADAAVASHGATPDTPSAGSLDHSSTEPMVTFLRRPTSTQSRAAVTPPSASVSTGRKRCVQDANFDCLEQETELVKARLVLVGETTEQVREMRQLQQEARDFLQKASTRMDNGDNCSIM